MFNKKRKRIKQLLERVAVEEMKRREALAKVDELQRENERLVMRAEAGDQEIRQQIRRIQELGKFYRTEEPAGVIEAVTVEPEDLVFRKMLPDRPTSEILNNNKHIILAQIVNRLIDQGYVQFITTEDPKDRRQAIQARLFVIPWDKMVTDRVCVIYDR